ncbi:hypothetical protein RYA05_19410 [Pseudomonas syringae pv. actinidiae]|uniref:Uncharacterized conserved protein RhaS n=2 Tax=Pseudomonas syringae group TaxID=136849 RepID=A0A0K8M2B6_PSESF|nr:hypothetical protein [Pseudomonas syringae]EPN12201.1 hypothetical protein A259_19495 [Pseudomonas syringae pv. actinidiae ICMP 19070]EPN73514.1 hypothetical protein A234_18435 [Pseudomonas syringae pv. actinidiae ICMP 19101]OZI83036.1 hypothetical protein CFN58_33925 [Pseudomonas avellanae]AKT30462.1 hypothetical protein IYO_013185 [Pseudomonas syringae pv. actinidiae ICMP 18884]AOE56895.1 hypothetical protein NZ708_13165 [Pseudomonas syringae pv. actinidiae ICMP 18708]
MNINKQPTIAELARLFAARKDTLDNHIVWIADSGEVHVDAMSPFTQESDFRDAHPQMRTALKMFRRGQGYVGKKAAADRTFMENTLQALQGEWQKTRRHAPSHQVA